MGKEKYLEVVGSRPEPGKEKEYPPGTAGTSRTCLNLEA